MSTEEKPEKPDPEGLKIAWFNGKIAIITTLITAFVAIVGIIAQNVLTPHNPVDARPTMVPSTQITSTILPRQTTLALTTPTSTSTPSHPKTPTTFTSKNSNPNPHLNHYRSRIDYQ